MRRFLLFTAVAGLSACSSGVPVDNQQALIDAQKASAQTPQPVTLTAPDGVTVFGTYYPAQNARAIILLFHQAGSSKDEYVSIAPQLQRAGFAALAIDQRAGGALFGKNQTIAGLSKPVDQADNLGALPDMEAALAWAKTKQLPVVLWGSSYSASLVFLLAGSGSNKDAVKAVLAFSPGEYFSDKTMIAAAAKKVTVPVFVTSAVSTEEEGEAKAIAEATASTDRQLYVPRTGFHGSSTLISARNPGGADENWAAVLAFLKRVFP